MPSPERAIGYHKLETKFFETHVQHTTFHSDASQGKRRVEVVKTWRRDRELGRGSFGTVFLERSETGELRAVKDIAKDRNSRIKIYYERELVAMAVLTNSREVKILQNRSSSFFWLWLTALQHDALFVQLLGWYESDSYLHIAMEYISHGDLRHYLEVERSESEAKAVIRQLLEGLIVIHQEGFAHRDLKPENIFVVSTFPIWVKIGDFGLAKLARASTAFRTTAGTLNYVAPEMEIDPRTDTSEYTNAVDLWSTGCITHELLTQVLPFQSIKALISYCYCPEFPRESMISKNISQKGIEFVESTLAYPPERRITAKEALDSEWLRPECRGAVGPENGGGPAAPEGPTPILPAAADGASPPDNGEMRFPGHVGSIRAVTWDDGKCPGELLPLGSGSDGVAIPPSHTTDHGLTTMAEGFRPRRSESERAKPGRSIHEGSSRSAEKARSEERELRKREQARMDNDATQLKADIGARAQAEKTKLERMEDSQLELALQISKLQLEKEKAKVIELLEQRQREQAQREQEQRDERDLRDAGYDLRDGLYNATEALSDAIRKRRDLRMIRLLLERGANPTSCIVQPRFSHRSALHVAAEVGYADAIGMITETESGATELDIRDSYGDTALSWAASSGRKAVANILLAKGANPDTTNMFGRTPLILAALFGNEAVVRLLLSKGAKLDITDNATDTALTCAAGKGYEAVVRLLLTNGAKHDIRNIHGETALSLATKRGHGPVVRLLREHAARQGPQVTPFATRS